MMPSMATNSRRRTGRLKTRPSRRWRSAGLGCLLLVLFVGCSSKEEQIVDPRDLQNIKLGEIVHLSGMLKKPAQAVCVLTAYRDRLNEEEPLSRRVNAGALLLVGAMSAAPRLCTSSGLSTFLT